MAAVAGVDDPRDHWTHDWTYGSKEYLQQDDPRIPVLHVKVWSHLSLMVTDALPLRDYCFAMKEENDPYIANHSLFLTYSSWEDRFDNSGVYTVKYNDLVAALPSGASGSQYHTINVAVFPAKTGRVTALFSVGYMGLAAPAIEIGDMALYNFWPDMVFFEMVRLRLEEIQGRQKRGEV